MSIKNLMGVENFNKLFDSIQKEVSSFPYFWAYLTLPKLEKDQDIELGIDNTKNL